MNGNHSWKSFFFSESQASLSFNKIRKGLIKVDILKIELQFIGFGSLESGRYIFRFKSNKSVVLIQFLKERFLTKLWKSQRWPFWINDKYTYIHTRILLNLWHKLQTTIVNTSQQDELFHARFNCNQKTKIYYQFIGAITRIYGQLISNLMK